MEPTNEVRIRLSNTTDFDLLMGLKFVKLEKSKQDTPYKMRPENLSPVQEFKSSSGVKLDVPSKSPHNILYKGRVRESEKK